MAICPVGGPDLAFKRLDFLLCISEHYLYFLKPVQQVCPPIAYLSIMNLYKLGNCVCKWVVRCLTTNRCTCGCVITGFAFVKAHFLKQPSSLPYLPAPSLPPPPARVPRCVARPGVCLPSAPVRGDEASSSGPPAAPARPPPHVPCSVPLSRVGWGLLALSADSWVWKVPVTGGFCAFPRGTPPERPGLVHGSRRDRGLGRGASVSPTSRSPCTCSWALPLRREVKHGKG